MTTLFVSDLHLDPARPEITALFLRFLQEEAAGADALYLLGDLFEAWIGDDDPAPLGAEVASGLGAVADAGVPVYFMHGNRDFLLGRDYAARAGMRLLPDPAVVMLYGHPTLLTHGDALCSDDHAYQAFRAQTRDPAWRERFLAQPLAARQAFARQAREASRQHQATVGGGAADITDVTPDTVAALFSRYGVDRVIHGHTHRPAVHTLEVDGRTCTRIVLGDWFEQGSVLRVDADRLELSALG
ncbi:UDP-2,3-diacylglucosamine diphosphatase [Coralloluteibacterium stylophorae]|uniref:UDP-2,3-diacylglucosamine hydrolase n=1 Tax=Coralloluteibacterium stylophorae TaxID=1776034 RepID=A0A8J7VSX7_9GAMM|nr:UDP-2,3-diacylglucosamine diphosphatase [Coralloluteibacterium stylophorae]MBS7456530.1 UDP-2,3-diacylglucosamine diphosphatase [Coralloluteibacterium stylophorae]